MRISPSRTVLQTLNFTQLLSTADRRPLLVMTLSVPTFVYRAVGVKLKFHGSSFLVASS